MKKWQKKLTAGERRHLSEIVEKGVVPTLAIFKRTREWQREKKIKCPECRSIALSLGIEKPGEEE